jgi:hypothetical protein
VLGQLEDVIQLRDHALQILEIQPATGDRRVVVRVTRRA